MARGKSFNELSDVELIELLNEAKDDLFNLRFQNVIGQLSNHALLKQTKKDVARIMTELRTREIALAEAAEADEAMESAGATDQTDS